MAFRITGLDPAPFRDLYGARDAVLAARGARRCIADATPGFPDRVELRDAEPGESLLLLNHVHLDGASPFRASHAIYVREGAETAYDRVDEIPAPLLLRAISLRAFDAAHMMVDADLAEGAALAPAIAWLLQRPGVAFVHAHYAKPGCYAALITRV